MKKKPLKIDFQNLLKDFESIEYKIDKDKFITNYQSIVEYEFKPKFFIDKSENYFYKEGFYLFPINRIVAEEIIADFVRYFENRFTHPQGDNKLKRCIEKLNVLVKSFDL